MISNWNIQPKWASTSSHPATSDSLAMIWNHCGSIPKIPFRDCWEEKKTQIYLCEQALLISDHQFILKEKETLMISLWVENVPFLCCANIFLPNHAWSVSSWGGWAEEWLRIISRWCWRRYSCQGIFFLISVFNHLQIILNLQDSIIIKLYLPRKLNLASVAAMDIFSDPSYVRTSPNPILCLKGQPFCISTSIYIYFQKKKMFWWLQCIKITPKNVVKDYWVLIFLLIREKESKIKIK